MLRVLSNAWWILILRGVLAIIFGLLAFGWPGLTLLTLVTFFGAYIFIDGLFSIYTSISNWKERDDHWLSLLSGIAGVGIGVVTFRTPGITALVLLMFIATWALVIGVLQIAAAIRLRKEMEGEFWLGLSGVLSIVFAFLLWSFPGEGAMSVIFLIGAYAILLGISLIALGLKLRSFGKRLESLAPAACAPSRSPESAAVRVALFSRPAAPFTSRPLTGRCGLGSTSRASLDHRLASRHLFTEAQPSAILSAMSRTYSRAGLPRGRPREDVRATPPGPRARTGQARWFASFQPGRAQWRSQPCAHFPTDSIER
jgi:uncharacterized membrane protein HdeD (DUF308 family)